MRFLLDSARADNKSVMCCGSVSKYISENIFSLKTLNYRGADRYVYI